MDNFDSLFLYGKLEPNDLFTSDRNKTEDLSDKHFCYYILILANEPEYSKDSLSVEIEKFPKQKRGTYYYTALAYLKYQEFQYEESISILNSSIKLDVSNTNYLNYILLGYNFHALGERPEAEEAYYIGYQKFPENPEILFRYADYLMGQIKFDSAAAVLSKVPNDFDISGVYRLKGDIAFHRKFYSEAEKHYLQSLNVDSTNLDSHIGIALCLVESGQADSALNYITEVNKKNDDVWVNFYYASILIKNGKYIDAQLQLEKLVLLDPQLDFCETLTFDIYKGQNKFQEGIEFYGNLLGKTSANTKCLIYCHFIFLKYRDSLETASSVFLSGAEDGAPSDCTESLGYLESLFLMK